MKKLILAALLLQSGHLFAQAGKSKNTGGAVYSKIAYVNIDSLESKCNFLAQMRDEAVKRHEKMENDLEQSYDQMQKEEEAAEKKSRTGRMADNDNDGTQKRLAQMQQNLENRKQELTDLIAKDQEDLAIALKTSLNAFIEEYNKTWHYDCVLSYSSTDLRVLYINKQSDITRDVINGMNANGPKSVKKKNK